MTRAKLVTFACALVCAAPAHGQDDQGRPWRLSAEPLLAIGRTDGPPEELFSRIVGAVRLPDGRYAVADGRELRITVYDPTGRLLSVFGREGSGPGEFRSIYGIWSIGDTLSVWDERLQRITRFSPAGDVLRTDALRFGPVRPPADAGSLDPFLGVFSDGRIALGWLAAGRGPPEQLVPDRMVLGLFDAEGTFLKVLGRAEGLIRIHKPGVGGGPFVFSPFPSAAVSRDRLVFTDGLTDALVFDPDASSQMHTRRLPLPGPEISLRDAWRELEQVLDESNWPKVLLDLARSTDRSIGRVPRIARMFADDRARLWLKEYDPSKDAIPVRRGTGGRWRIVDPSGEPIAHIAMPAHISPLAVYGDHLLAVGRDSLDVERFMAYRIIH